ncbi:MAG TPA: pitrilysin family protein [Steroidobacteraceae bacterium]|jgi:zinc protease|nr:pitrilysin family protein [Steroidobacteraceae bacterium]
MSTAYALTHPSGGAVQVPAHERVVLPNGITLLVVPSPEVPLISFHAVCRGGPLGDSQPGLASLVAGLLDKGAGARNAFEFVDAVEGAGGSFTTVTGTEALSITGQFLARDQALMLELLSDAITRPRFEIAEFEKLRARRIELIKAAKDSDPAEVIGTYGRAMLFGSHPYGKPAGGSEASLASITHRDVLDYYRAHIGADRLILVFAGDLDIAALKRDVAERFGSWRKAGVSAAPVPEPVRARGRRVLLVDSPDSAQTYFWIGNVGVNKQYPEHAALDLVNTLYGGCFTSMLNTELRIKSGLSYSARAGFTRTAAAGEFAIRSFTDTENTATALDLSLQTLMRLKTEGVTTEMLDSARAYVLGQYPLNFETAADWAAALVELEFYGLGPEYIDEYAAQLRGVTLPVARGVIDHAFPNVEDLVIVLIGDAAKIRRIARRYGELTEMALTQPSFSP